MAAAAAFGAVCGGDGGTAGAVGAGQGVPGFGFGILPPERVVGAVDLRLRHRGVFEPAARTRHVRFGGVSLHCGQRPSRPRHHRRLPQPLSAADRGAVCPGPAAGAGERFAEAGHGGAGRHQAARQCQPAQRAVLRACEQDRRPAEGGGRRVAGAGSGRRPGGCAGWDVDPGRAGPARGALAPAGRRQGEDRGAGQGAPGARAGRVHGEGDSARGAGPDHRQEAGRATAAAAGGGAGPDRPDQSDRRRFRASCRSPAAASSRPTMPRRR